MSASLSMWTKTSFKLAEGNIEMEITKCSSTTGRWTQYNEHVVVNTSFPKYAVAAGR